MTSGSCPKSWIETGCSSGWMRRNSRRVRLSPYLIPKLETISDTASPAPWRRACMRMNQLPIPASGARIARFGRRTPPSSQGSVIKALRLDGARFPSGAQASIREARGSRPAAERRIVFVVASSPLSLIEFPADDPERARRFWTGFLGAELEARQQGEGEGWQTHSDAPTIGIHARGRGPGDSFSLPYFAVGDIAEALDRVAKLGGIVVHPGAHWAICKDSEGSPFGLAQEPLDS